MSVPSVWLTGLPSSGKSTIAGAVASRLRAAGRRCEVLDGDVIRQHLAQDLGYDRLDRDSNVRRVAWVSRMLAAHEIVPIVAVIAPYSEARGAARNYHAVAGVGFIEIHVSTPFEVCRTRDVKGLYARAARGEITGLTGYDDPYEVPANPELSVDTSAEPLEVAVEKILGMLELGGGSVK